jgi:hypothetical protein
VSFERRKRHTRKWASIGEGASRRGLANLNFAFGNKVGFRPIWPLQSAELRKMPGIANKQNEQRLAIIGSPL